jgi:protease IV
VLGAIRIPPLARLSRPKNSEDPRTWDGTAWPGLRDVAAALGLPADAALRMPNITLR